MLRDVELNHTILLCDVSGGVPRPLVPSQHRREVFNTIHGLAHLGPVPKTRVVSDHFVWHNLKKDIKSWCRECLDCQSNKVGRHVKTPFEKVAAPDRRFGHLHVNLVGPLPQSKGHSYVSTMVDRWSRWPEAIPVPDRGAQFTSSLWREMGKTLSIKNINTTAYHPQSNGLVERFPCTLKASLMATGEPAEWMGLPLHVLLGIRTAQRQTRDSHQRNVSTAQTGSFQANYCWRQSCRRRSNRCRTSQPG